MRTYKWAIIAGACAVVLIATAALLVPRLFGSSSGDANAELVEPGHWWKMTLNEEQAGIWRELWGGKTSPWRS